MSPDAPHNPRRLVGTRWTAAHPEEGRRHWEAVAYRASSGLVVLEAVIDRTQITLPWRDLRLREHWLPDWQ
jgi:tryptophan-rich hypothetical protein